MWTPVPLKGPGFYTVARTKADAYVFGGDERSIRPPDTMTSWWDRCMELIT
ncbi:hypothetical protein GCM10022198_08290 [Klugiella xanthotipulae]